MKTPNHPTDTPSGDSELPAPGRRKLLRGAVGAAPVLMTLASRPVLGSTNCTTMSGFNSAGSAPGRIVQCNGLPPAAWSNNPDSWPSPYVAANSSSLRLATLGGGRVTPATLFHSTTTGFNGTIFGGKPLSEVLQMPDGGTMGLGKHVSAALLNAASGRTPVLTPGQVKNVWNDYLARGYFEPTAGVRWYAEDIVRYIRSTMS